jgi:acyl carrier protein
VDTFPEWGWPTYPRIYTTVPSSVEAPLRRLLAITPGTTGGLTVDDRTAKVLAPFGGKEEFDGLDVIELIFSLEDEFGREGAFDGLDDLEVYDLLTVQKAVMVALAAHSRKS